MPLALPAEATFQRLWVTIGSPVSANRVNGLLTEENKSLEMRKYVLALSLLLLVTNAHADAPQHPQTYRLYFIESTGYNTYVMVKGEPKYFYFDKEHSSSPALESWMNLKWNVRYPNAKGRVRATGFLNEKDHLFVIQKWALESPFAVWYQTTPDDLSTNYIVKLETKFTCAHFENKCPDKLESLVFDAAKK